MMVCNDQPPTLWVMFCRETQKSSQQPAHLPETNSKKKPLKINGSTMTIFFWEFAGFLKDVGCSFQGVYFFTIFRFELISLGVRI